MGAMKVSREERGELYKLLLDAVFENIPPRKLLELIVEKWGEEKAREFASDLAWCANEYKYSGCLDTKWKDFYFRKKTQKKGMRTYFPIGGKETPDETP